MRTTWAWIVIAVGVLVGCGDDETGGSTSPLDTTTVTSSASGTAGAGASGGAGGAGGAGGSGGAPEVCGNGSIGGDESCDDGATRAGDGCSDTCQVEDGWACSGQPSVCATKCGDGNVAGAEACDDGNTVVGDGCTQTCAIEPGYSCAGEPSVCTTGCGDGTIAGSEACDDLNVTDGDGCSAACTVEDGWTCMGEPSACSTTCGDGNVAGLEECDDGGTNAGDGCDAACVIEDGWTCMGEPSTCSTTCGDGNVAGLEECDDGGTNAGDGCDDACVEETGYTCAGEPSVCATTCGDGLIAGTEACDDGDATSGDGCDATCSTVEPGYTCVGAPSVCKTTCGDGLIAGTEECDDGDGMSGDGCSSTCVVQVGYTCTGAPSVCTPNCGDGTILGTEECDDGGTTSGDGCTATCTVEPGFVCVGEPSQCNGICGDGLIVGAETCDDSGQFPGDGCSATCSIELGWTCSGMPSLCDGICGDNLKVSSEECDDGNVADGDLCTSTCEWNCLDESETNDTIATADGPLATEGLVCAAITPAADVDFFAFTLPVTADVRIETFDFNGPGQCAAPIGTALELRADAATLLATDTIDGVNSCSKIDAFGATPDYAARRLPPGTYYARVIDNGQNATIPSYLVEIDYLSECGDGVLQGSEQCDPPGPTCQANCTNAPTCGNGVVEAPETCDDGNTASGDGCSSACLVEGVTFNETEPNLTLAHADASPVQITGDALIGASLDHPGDIDTYRVVLAAPAVVRFETFDISKTTCPTASFTTQLTVMNAAGTPVSTDSSINTAGINSCSALVMHLDAGTYYVRVNENGLNATIPTYVLEVNVQADGGTEVELNDTLGTANGSLGGGADVFVAGGHQVNADQDWYSLTVPANASIRAEIIEGSTAETCESLGIASRLTLFNSAMTQLVLDTIDGRGSCSQIDGTGLVGFKDSGAHNLTAGTYYLRVDSTAAGAAGQFDYRLVVTVRTP